MTTPARSQRLLQQILFSIRRMRPATHGACLTCELRSQWTSFPDGRPSPRLRNLEYYTLPRRFTSTFANTSSSDSSSVSGTGAEGRALDITNHYTIFPKTLPGGPPPGSPFDIAVGDLRQEFLQLQNISHPDKYPSGPEKRRAEAFSTLINEAYRTLADPLLRAQYLLREMHGIDVTAEDGATKHALDSQTLMEVMGVQEAIEEVSGDADAEAKIAQLKTENSARVADGVRKLAAAFDRGDLETVRQECVRLKFWYNVAETLKEWEPGMTEIRLVH